VRDFHIDYPPISRAQAQRAYTPDFNKKQNPGKSLVIQIISCIFAANQNKSAKE